MENHVQNLNDLSIQLANYMWPWFLVMVSLVVVMLVKDFITKLVKGLEFKMSSDFGDGDKVLLDGEKAIIIKIGITTTVFGMVRQDGIVWRYVQNERIPSLKLEKLITEITHGRRAEDRENASVHKS